LGSKDLQAYDIKCRIIYATNKDLVNEIDNNNFRTDLYFIISDSIIEIPPLRHRKEDIDLLIASFMAKFIKKNNIKDPDYIKQLNEIEIDENSLTQLKNYDFPGNIRELEKIVYQSIIDYLMNNLKKLSFKTQKPQPNTLNVEKNMKVYSVELILNLIKNNIIKADSLNDEVKYDIVKQLEYQNYKRENIADLLKIKKASLNNFISNFKKSNA